VPGSSSIEDNAKNAATHNIISEFKKVTGAKVKTTSTSKTRKKKNVTVSNKRKSAKTSIKAKATPVKVTRKTKDSSFSQVKLYAALNMKINSVVAKNMEFPGLQYQTGRFAGGVKITDVSKTPQGFASIGYTYQKYPYQTFEPGFAQGSVERDPRKLIDRSIREIAAQTVIGRLYTRRQ
jgi:hypothetical protein